VIRQLIEVLAFFVFQFFGKTEGLLHLQPLGRLIIAGQFLLTILLTLVKNCHTNKKEEK
jgi:hypothetical protein